MPPGPPAHFARRSQTRAARHGSLANKIHRLHENGAYSDLTIVCGSDTYHVHKAIICPQSDWFTAACRPDTFKEGKTNIINIPGSSGRDESADPLIDSDDFDWDLDVETTTSVKLMIHYFYHHGYLEVLGIPGLARYHVALFAENARMYAMGEKYGVAGLKHVARAKSSALSDLKVSANMVRVAAVIAFNSTPDSDKKMREAIVEMVDVVHQVALIRNNKLLQKSISTIPELAYGLYRKSLECKEPRYMARDVSARVGEVDAIVEKLETW